MFKVPGSITPKETMSSQRIKMQQVLQGRTLGKGLQISTRQKSGGSEFSWQTREELFLGELPELYAAQTSIGDSWKAKVSLNGLLTELKLDTGADVTVILPSLYHSLQPAPSLSRTTRLLIGQCKQKLSCLGTFIAELQVQDKVAKKHVYVIDDLERPLLGRKPAELLKKT